jgi:hypothetical protein
MPANARKSASDVLFAVLTFLHVTLWLSRDRSSHPSTGASVTRLPCIEAAVMRRCAVAVCTTVAPLWQREPAGILNAAHGWLWLAGRGDAPVEIARAAAGAAAVVRPLVLTLRRLSRLGRWLLPRSSRRHCPSRGWLADTSTYAGSSPTTRSSTRRTSSRPCATSAFVRCSCSTRAT